MGALLLEFLVSPSRVESVLGEGSQASEGPPHPVAGETGPEEEVEFRVHFFFSFKEETLLRSRPSTCWGVCLVPDRLVVVTVLHRCPRAHKLLVNQLDVFL